MAAMPTPEPDAHAHKRKPREAGTRAILDALIDGDQQQTLDFNALLGGLGRRAFGMLLFVAPVWRPSLALFAAIVAIMLVAHPVSAWIMVQFGLKDRVG